MLGSVALALQRRTEVKRTARQEGQKVASKSDLHYTNLRPYSALDERLAECGSSSHLLSVYLAESAESSFKLRSAFHNVCVRYNAQS